MKTLLLLPLLMVTLISAYSAPKTKADGTDTLTISITLKTKQDTLMAEQVAVVVEFKNQSGVTIRIPDIFKNLYSNAYLSVTGESNRSVIPIRVALEDYTTQSVTSYVSIGAHSSYKKTVSIGDILMDKSVQLTGGKYKLELTYYNGKGVNCILGTYFSNPVYFTIPRFITLNPVAADPPKTRTVSVVSNVVTFTATRDTSLHAKPFKPLTESKNKTGKFKDKRDGQVYTWVKIGKQVWMSQNLNYKSKVGCSYAYNNDTTNLKKFGLYYDYAALQDVCPEGWHIPSDAEWKQLEIDGGVPPEQVGKSGWEADDISNFLPGGSSGFNVLYSGIRRSTRVEHVDTDQRAYFWTTREPGAPTFLWRRIFMKDYNRIMRATQGTAYNINIRCVKDADE